MIVDEAHGAAAASAVNQGQHQRHQLVKQLAADPNRHLILLTATPHSGIPTAFQSLLGLIRPEFASWDVAALDESKRAELAKHFVQRTRADIEHQWESAHCFPKRLALDETYPLSAAYRELFAKTYDLCAEIVRTGAGLDERRRRVRDWGALALLRCVMSSPAAATVALQHRATAAEGLDEGDLDLRPFVFDPDDRPAEDAAPTPAIASAETELSPAEGRRLRQLAQLAQTLGNPKDDLKLARAIALIDDLLRAGHSPILWCRYIATAEYLARGLEEALGKGYPGLRVLAITGRQGEEERRALVEELARAPKRILVATDCLSEGINLQQVFDAVLHYDLPWNPNRLEQREGRVDRYGQPAPTVKTIRYFSPDSPIDGVVLEVLLNKAREIHRALGTHVPVPEESETVTQAVLSALFLRGRRTSDPQLPLDLDLHLPPAVAELHKRWERDAERERLSRTRFAQRSLKPEEVARELEAADGVLGDPQAVREFVLACAQRLDLPLTPDRRLPEVFRLDIGPQRAAGLPDAVREALPQRTNGVWRISFVSPTPEGADYLGRNHRFVAALARFLLEDALTRHGQAYAARCGVIRTRAVERLTTLWLLRVRYLLTIPERAPLLAEEVWVEGCVEAAAGERRWLTATEALGLLTRAVPDANIPRAEKRERIAAALADWQDLQEPLAARLKARAGELAQAHRRIRQAVHLRVRELRVEPQLPLDLLSLLVLQPGVAP